MSDFEHRLRSRIREVPNFPRPGISFKDITPVLADPDLLAAVTGQLAHAVREQGLDKVVGIEARGFIFAAPLAIELGVGFVPVRKPGKLPARTVRIDYALEYGSDALEAHDDALSAGERVLVVDDVLATGGTASATMELVRRLGAEVVAAAFVVELDFLEGRSRLGGVPVISLVRYAAGG